MSSRIRMKLLIGAVCTFAAAAAAAIDSKDLVNERIKDVLSVFQNQLTKVEFRFKELEISDARVESAAIRVFYDKMGAHNRLALDIKNASYKYYVRGERPTFKARGGFDLDLVKVLGQKRINEMVDEAEELVTDMSEDIVRRYGNAAEVRAEVIEVIRDSNGDVVSVELEFEGRVDLCKLPKSVPVGDVEWLRAEFNAKIGRSGGSLDLTVEMNPKYRAFKREETGLKEWLERLIDNDREAYESIQQIVAYLDRAAESIVNEEPKN